MYNQHKCESNPNERTKNHAKDVPRLNFWVMNKSNVAVFIKKKNGAATFLAALP